MASPRMSTWYNIPLVVGHHIGAVNDVILQDGFLSSIHLFLVVIALGSALIFAAWISETDHHVHGGTLRKNWITATDLDIFLIVIMLVSCILILVLCKCFRRHLRPIHNHHEYNAFNLPLSLRIRKVLKEKLPLIGIILFFVPSIFLDFFTLAAEVECLQAIPCNKWRSHVFEYIIQIVFNLSRATFMSTLVGFALFFHHKRFTRHMVVIRYILMWILASTLILWLDTFVHELIHHGKEAEHPEYFALKIMEGCAPQNSIVETSPLLVQCLNQNTTLFDFKEALSSYLYPLNIEFALLVTEIVAHIYIAMNYESKKWKQLLSQRSVQLQCVLGMGTSVRNTSSLVVNESQNQSGQPRIVRTHTGSLPHLGNRHFQSPSSTEDCTEGERTPLLNREGALEESQNIIPDAVSPTTSARGTSSSVHIVHRQYTDITESSTQNHRVPNSCLFCSGIMGLIINSVLLTMAVLQFNGFGSANPSFTAIYASARVTYFLAMIICTYIALYYCKNFNSRFQNYSGLEMIVILSQAVIFLQDFMSVIAYIGTITTPDNGLSNFGGSAIPSLHIADKVTNTFSMMIQTAFMFHATRISVPEGADTQRNNLKRCLLFLAICNIFMWTIDSFFEISKLTRVEPIQTEYYSERTWSMISYISRPFAIFYRFNAFFILLGGYLDH